ncbi:thiamine phosphate synthase [Methylobacterium sp. J-090]|uniref:thiamine phosphate synthase n=1 Tax=Methylobacterium sp. J-090 TaxID=2836666 RepID=UPI001FB8BC42|nr:thiamine phosphate synthase [Methylobacterium sp. J-090]MCJ2082255.1 thiamine phosphate synthase [Methylobacterium sp. J-090]
MRALPSPLLVVTDRTLVPGGEPALAAHLDALLTGGARWVWFRERDMAQGPREKLARAVLARVRARGGILSIGASAALAADLGADGVHLPGGATPADLAEARRRLPGGLIGVSAHTLEDVGAAARHGADYATLSPIYATSSKPGYGPALGPAALRAAASHGLPVIALGGVTGETARPCRDAGATGIAVMGGLMRGLDPARDAGALLDAWGT